MSIWALILLLTWAMAQCRSIPPRGDVALGVSTQICMVTLFLGRKDVGPRLQQTHEKM